MNDTGPWLSRPSTIRSLWRGFAVVLLVVAGFDFVFSPKGHFGIDSTPAFNAWYGFLACVAMVLVAKALGAFVKRRDTYYGD